MTRETEMIKEDGRKLCGASKQAVISRLMKVVAPKYQRPLRWGMKNPHSTYYVNVLYRIFPCMVYVNTLRDLDVMVRTRKHFDSRVREAVMYKLAPVQVAEEYKSWSLSTSQRFYGHLLQGVNGRLNQWLRRCAPKRFVHISLQRLVVRASPVLAKVESGTLREDRRRHAACFDAAVLPLLRLLGLQDAGVSINVTHRFLSESLPTVLSSVNGAAEYPLELPRNDKALIWPPGLDPHACRGPLLPRTVTGHHHGREERS